MKYLANIFIAVAGLLYITSCEDIGDQILDMPVTESITIDTVFNNAEYAERVLNFMYRSVPQILPDKHDSWDGLYNQVVMGEAPREALSDLTHSFKTWGTIADSYYNAKLNQFTGHKKDDWRGNISVFDYYDDNDAHHWRAIRHCHIILDNIDRVPDLTQKEKDHMKGEALSIKCFHYYNLFRNFGGVPWIDHLQSVNGNLLVPRATVEATVDSVCKNLDIAFNYLEWEIPAERRNIDLGRWTKAGVLTLKAKILLFAASPLFNADAPYLSGEAADKKMCWYGNYDQNRWKRLYDVTTELIAGIEGSSYGLEMPNANTPVGYRKAFRKSYFYRDSKECLISFRYGRFTPTRYQDNVKWWGEALPTQNFIEMFAMADGTPITDDGSGYDATNNPYGLEGDDPTYNRDPRLYETVLLNKSDWDWRKAYYYANDGGATPKEGWQLSHGTARKFLPEKDLLNNVNYHYAFGRVSEVYLMHAEAANELGNRTVAIQYLNKIRNRVGMKNIQEIDPSVTSWTTERFRKEILDERAKEFFMEEIRWYDITRWKLEECFTKTLYKPYNEKIGDDTFKYGKKEIETQPRFWKDNFTAKWYLNCFPYNEVQKQYGIVQNPGWE